jgi:hypothetical protein
MASENVPPRGTERTVVMSRDGQGDQRTVVIPLAALRDVKWTEMRGGDGELLRRPTIGAMVDASFYPMEWRSGAHREKNAIWLLAEPEDNDPDVYSELSSRADEAPRHRSQYWKQLCRKRFPNRPAQALLAFLDLQFDYVDSAMVGARDVTA